MRLLRYLQEKWIHAFHDRTSRGQKIYVEVFVSPSKKEFRETAGSTKWDVISGQYVRFLADIKKHKVYIWNPETIHGDAWKEFGDGRDIGDPTLLLGVAQLQGGKWKMADSDSGVRRNIMKYDLEDWEWANKWIDVTTYLEDFKVKFNL